MFRTTILAIAATAALGAATLASTPASAAHAGWHGRHHHGWHHRWHPRPVVSFRFVAPRAYAYAPRCHTVRRWVRTHYGWRLRPVRVCR